MKPMKSKFFPLLLLSAAISMATISYAAEVGDDIHTEVEKRQNPSKRQTGVLVFKGKPNAPFAMPAAGGGFAYVGSLHEGFPIA